MTGVRKIGILGHVGNENLGDEAIIAAVIQNIKCRYPDAKTYGFTLNPADTEKRHNIVAFPIRRIDRRNYDSKKVTAPQSFSVSPTVSHRIKIILKKVPLVYGFLRGLDKAWHSVLASLREVPFLIKCYRNLKGTDLLIVAGSQQLIDYVGGPWAHTYTLFKWTLLAKTTKTKVAFVSVGAGPIYSALGKFFARTSLGLASYRSYRDETSRAFVETLGVFGLNTVSPDLVYSLQIQRSFKRLQRDTLPIVGINPVPFSDERYWEGASPIKYEIYTSNLASFALWVIQRGYRVWFFPTQLQLDPPVINDIKNVLKVKADRDLSEHIVNQPISCFDDLVSAIGVTDIVVATRFHGIILPYVLNKPVLGIAYQRKTVDLMAQMGQSDYVVDINSFDVESLKTRFVLLESRCAAIKKEIEERKSVFRNALHVQYDQVLSLI
jgi:polysaccharide pyruvyl transferase WcaK-like protein